MTQEPEPRVNETVAVAKLIIDRQSDFKFHVAYLAYSRLWDKTASQESRARLNEIILALSKQEIDYPTFYEEISQYGGDNSKSTVQPRKIIITQRKSEWRKREASSSRNARYKRRR